ncbi:MAG: VWA domain-containing protein [Thermoanaerobaculum sp.]
MVGLLLVLASAPLALRVEVEPLGRGSQGTVVAVAVQVAPEERAQLGQRVRFSLEFWQQGNKVDAGEGVVELAADGSFLLYREWPAGAGTLRVKVGSADGSRQGGVERKVVVPVMETRFQPPEDAPPDAAALLPSPPPEEVVRFAKPRSGSTVGTVELALEAPAETGEVRFFQDGHPLLTKNRPPWQLSLSLGAVPRRTVVRAEAWSAEGRFLGEDAVVLAGAEGRLEVQLLVREGDPVRVTVAVSPPGTEEDVELSLDDKPYARWLACPCVAEVPQALWKSARVAVAEARGGGKTGEAVLVVGSNMFLETARVEVVELPVVVTDATGRFVSDVNPQEFEVLEDGRPVEVTSVSWSQDQPVSLGLAVDTSGSMVKDFALVRDAVGGFLGSFLRPRDRFFVGTFSWEFKLLVEWASDPRLAQDRLRRVSVEGGTSLHDAVIKALELFRGRKGPKALVVITDGEDTTSRTGWEHALRFARTTRTPVFPIGIRLSLLDFLLRGKLGELATDTGGEAFFIGSPEDLQAVYKRIGEQLRSQYLVAYRVPADAPLDRFRQVTVRVRREGVRVRTIPGYLPAP